ncbi:RNA polymerase II subunit A C-terminal domain phosphatase [Smittium mucronatum]|uniref:RNA polymerase II subunit A C-terminal domain phosphatase n=1 Tax=Smittium mucronatum TaxID=133383 RepID=A0A1R0H6E2_9FUNG|nr:RNA polymerase II subunit A C-terminal domain phosphatase [Smittium mucronatum]
MEKEHSITLDPLLIPATIKKLNVISGQNVNKGDELFIYEYQYSSDSISDPSSPLSDDVLNSALRRASHFNPPNTTRKVFYSPFKGQISDISISEGQKVLQPNIPLIKITEPCGHEIQFMGLCSICGEDLTFSDYSTRATVNMSYDVKGLMVSNDEALRIETINADRLVTQKKLSLILDLDQTLMHAYATDDPGFETWLTNNYINLDIPFPPSPSPTVTIDKNSEVHHLSKEPLTKDLLNQPATISSVPTTIQLPSSSSQKDSTAPENPQISEHKSISLVSEVSDPPSVPSVADVDTFVLSSSESSHINQFHDETSDSHKQQTPTMPDQFIDDSGIRKIAPDIGVFQLPGSHLNYYIKLRPGLPEFLSKASEKYELHIYTMGTRNYADLVAKLIDPSGKFFSDRILSRDESGSLTHKDIKRLFPCDESMVVVLDDRADVWSWSPNLIKIKEYSFFAGVGDINAIESISAVNNKSSAPHSAKEIEELTEQKLSDTEDETSEESSSPSSDDLLSSGKKPKKRLVDHDDELNIVMSVLESVHRNFYSNLRELDSRNESHSPFKMQILSHNYQLLPTSDILTFLRKDILKTSNIVFSPSFPKFVSKMGGDSSNDNYPHKELSEFWRIAEQFGASCSSEINNNTTHIVSSNRDSHHMRMIVYENIKRSSHKLAEKRRFDETNDNDNDQKTSLPPIIVGLEWLFDSICRWRWQDERKYLIFPNDKIKIYKVFPFDLSPYRDFDVLNVNVDGFFDNEESEESYSEFGSDTDVITSNLVSHVDWEDVDRELNELMSEADSEDEFEDDNEESNANSSGFEDVTDDTSETSSPTKRTKYTHIESKLDSGLAVNGHHQSPNENGMSNSVSDNDFDDEEEDDDDDFSDLIQNLDNEISL